MPSRGTTYIGLTLLILFLVHGSLVAQTAEEERTVARDSTEQVAETEENKSFLQKLFPFLFKGNKSKKNKEKKEATSNPYNNYTQEELNELFFKAAQNGNIQLVEETLKEGALINTRNVHGRTALIEAVRNNQYVMAKKLLDFGASVNVRDRYDATALTYAARTGNTRIYQLLINYGARE